MKRIIALLLTTLMLGGCVAQGEVAATPESSISPAGFDVSKLDLDFSNRERSGEWDEDDEVLIQANGSTAEINGSGAAIADGLLTIDKEGVYVITGTLTDVCIYVNVTKQEKVQLVLKDAEIVNSTGPAIAIEEADKVFITVPEGARATLSDGKRYQGKAADEGWDGVIFSRADLCLNGQGEMTVTGSCKHGVVSKDDLVIAGLKLNVTAASTALDGKDCVKATGATITVDAGTNGIRSNNDEDADRGFIYLKDCSITVDAGNDAVQAENALITEDTILNILSGSGQTSSVRYAAEGSWKGLKAGDIRLSGGSCFIVALDDAIHADGSILITSGSYTLSSGDDGIHAEEALTIEGGEIRITQSYEGLEAKTLTIAGGVIDVTASDDGLNAAGQAEATQGNNRWGRGRMMSNGVGDIIISGGYTVINASGDGIDSNNSITVSGGVTLVSGPESNGNAAFDYDGTAKITGGVLIATGPMGMAQNFTEAENQGAILVSFGPKDSGEPIALTDADGIVLASFTPENAYQCAVITAPGIQEGQTYTLITGCTVGGADENGFAQNTTTTGGVVIDQISMTSLLYGGNGGMGMWNMPGGGFPGENPGGGFPGGNPGGGAPGMNPGGGPGRGPGRGW